MKGKRLIELREEFAYKLNAKQYAIKTQRNYLQGVDDFLEFLQLHSVNFSEQVEMKHYRMFQEDLLLRASRRGGVLAITTIQNMLGGVKSFQKFNVEYLPRFLVIPLKKKSTNRKILSTDEVQQLFLSTHSKVKSKSDLWLAVRDRAMLFLYYGCGLRASEGTNLGIADLDLSQRRVLIRRTKNGRERYVPLSLQGIVGLREWLQLRLGIAATGHDRLLVTVKGEPIEPTSLYSRLQVLLKRSGIKSESQFIGLHTLRCKY